MSKYNYTPKKIIKILQQHDFHFVRQNGSHALFKNFQNNKKVIVPIHSKDLPSGTTRAIFKDAGII
ncbi:MAG: type II toxin-antitoxin system HicA family toxin [Candidatus Gracilibacteria bacterium]